jgi:uncharacterized protein YbjT (DUF2867 family)
VADRAAAVFDGGMATVLITGGTGTLGRRVAARLPDARILSRKPGGVVGDLVQGTGIDEALAGVDVVIHCASDQRTRHGDARGTRTLVEAAARRDHPPTIVYISIVGIDRIPLGYYRDKLASERVLEASGVPWTVLRTTQFHNLLYTLLTAVKGPIVPSPTRTSLQPIEVDEVAERLVELASQPAQGRVSDMGGPQVLPFAEIARSYLRAVGKRKALLPLHIPGGIGAALRAGHNCVPEQAVGRVTFAEFLARRPIGSP